MSQQSNAAAERSAHVKRGGAETPPAWPVVQLADGSWQLKAVVEANAEIEKLRAALRGVLTYYSAPTPTEAKLKKAVLATPIEQAYAALREKE
jgi:hypothetical protein